MISLTPQLLIATANAFVGVTRDFGYKMEGSLDVALVQHWGYWSHFDVRSERSSWPFETARTTSDLAKLGVALGILRDRPECGDVFLQSSCFPPELCCADGAEPLIVTSCSTSEINVAIARV